MSCVWNEGCSHAKLSGPDYTRYKRVVLSGLLQWDLENAGLAAQELGNVFTKHHLQLQPRGTMQSIAIAASVLKSTQDRSQTLLCSALKTFVTIGMWNSWHSRVKVLVCALFRIDLSHILSINTELLFLLVFLTVLSFVLQHQAFRNYDLQSCNLTWWSWDNVQCPLLKLAYKLHELSYCSS